MHTCIQWHVKAWSGLRRQVCVKQTHWNLSSDHLRCMLRQGQNSPFLCCTLAVCWCVWLRAFVPCPWHKVPGIIPHVQSIARHVIRLKWISFLSASTSVCIISLKCVPSHQGDVIMINCGGDGGTWGTDSGVFWLSAVCWAHLASIKMKELSKFHCYGNRFQSGVRSHKASPGDEDSCQGR